MPIVRGQNNTAAGIANALVGGNEQQQVTLTGFNATTQSFQVRINGQTSGVIGARRPRRSATPTSATAINAHPRLRGHRDGHRRAATPASR